MSKVITITCFMGLAFAGSSTREGIGKDVKGAGSSLEDAASKINP